MHVCKVVKVVDDVYLHRPHAIVNVLDLITAADIQLYDSRLIVTDVFRRLEPGHFLGYLVKRLDNDLVCEHNCADKHEHRDTDCAEHHVVKILPALCHDLVHSDVTADVAHERSVIEINRCIRRTQPAPVSVGDSRFNVLIRICALKLLFSFLVITRFGYRIVVIIYKVHIVLGVLVAPFDYVKVFEVFHTVQIGAQLFSGIAVLFPQTFFFQILLNSRLVLCLLSLLTHLLIVFRRSDFSELVKEPGIDHSRKVLRRVLGKILEIGIYLIDIDKICEYSYACRSHKHGDDNEDIHLSPYAETVLFIICCHRLSLLLHYSMLM